MHEVDDADQATGFLGLGLAGDRQLALDKVPLAKALNQKLRGFLATSGAKIFNMTQRFDGGYVQVSSYNGIERAFIYAEPTLPLEPDDLATAQILSGVTKDSDIIEVEDPDDPFSTVEALRDFKPTDQTWEYIYKKDPDKPVTSFNNEPRLAVRVESPPHQDSENLDPKTTKTREGVPIPDGEAAQTKEICGSMFSGLMAKAVQVIMGYGKLRSVKAIEDHRLYGVKVRYDWRWARCHGIVRGVDGHLWLVEISVANGVIAMPLPVFKNTTAGTPMHAQMLSSKQDVLRETVKLFGGLPSGGTFPGDINQAILDGDVIRLASVAHMAPFFGKGYYSSWMGWSFNLGGAGVQSEAHNTCYTADGENSTYVATGYHYKIVFNIGKKKSSRQPNEPIADGNATLSLVGSGNLTLLAHEDELAGSYVYPNGRYRFRINNGDGDLAFAVAPDVYPKEYVYNSFSPINTTGYTAGAVMDEEVVIIACHYGNTLDRIYIVNKTPISVYKTDPLFFPSGNVLTAHNRAPAIITDTTYNQNIYSTGVSTRFLSGRPDTTIPSNTSSSETQNFQQYGHSGGYIKSDRCTPFFDGLVMEQSFERHVDTTYSLISAVWVPSVGYDIAYSETYVVDDTRVFSGIYTDEVCAWSAYARDGYMVHEPSTSKSSRSVYPIPGTWEVTTTYGSEPKIRCVTTASKQSGVGDLRIPYIQHALSKRKALGFGGYATFTRSCEDGIPAWENYISSYEGKRTEPFGDKFYACLKFSVFGKNAHVIASVPFDTGVYKANYAAPDIHVPDPDRKNNEIAKLGALLEVEDITNPLAYSFIGYI